MNTKILYVSIAVSMATQMCLIEAYMLPNYVVEQFIEFSNETTSQEHITKRAPLWLV